MRKIKLNISYIGTDYCGWQVQPNGISVQKRLQDAVEKVFGKRYPLTGCSRTDSGVHAKCFVCTIDLDDTAPGIPTEKIPLVMNMSLPNDIAVMAAQDMPEEFHPRYSCIGKEYEYHYYDSPLRDPFLHGRVTCMNGRLDEKNMNECAACFTGKHDFTAFMSSGSKITDAVRTIYSCTVERQENSVILRVSADGFLYNMVRIIAGTLAKAGRGVLCPEDITRIIESKDRSNAGDTLPPEGLYLAKVFYPEEKEPNGEE